MSLAFISCFITFTVAGGMLSETWLQALKRKQNAAEQNVPAASVGVDNKHEDADKGKLISKVKY